MSSRVLRMGRSRRMPTLRHFPRKRACVTCSCSCSCSCMHACMQAGRQAGLPGSATPPCLPADSGSGPNAQGTHPPGQNGKNASPVLLMQIPLTAHGLMWYKPAYAASDASQQDWQDGCISWNGPARAAPPLLPPPLPSSGLDQTGPTTIHQQKMGQGALQSFTASPRRAGRMRNLGRSGNDDEGPWGGFGQSQMVSEPTSRSPKHISTTPPAALRPSLIRDNPTWLAWSTVAVQPTPPPSPRPPLSAPPLCVSVCVHIHITPSIPVPTSSKKIYTTHTTTATHGLPLLDLPLPLPGAGCWLQMQEEIDKMQRASLPRLGCSTGQEMLSLLPRLYY